MDVFWGKNHFLSNFSKASLQICVVSTRHFFPPCKYLLSQGHPRGYGREIMPRAQPEVPEFTKDNPKQEGLGTFPRILFSLSTGQCAILGRRVVVVGLFVESLPSMVFVACQLKLLPGHIGRKAVTMKGFSCHKSRITLPAPPAWALVLTPCFHLKQNERAK